MTSKHGTRADFGLEHSLRAKKRVQESLAGNLQHGFGSALGPHPIPIVCDSLIAEFGVSFEIEVTIDFIAVLAS